MKLYFENMYGESREIATCKNEEEVIKAIHTFVSICNKNKPKDKQFKIYYTRTWEEKDGKVWYDIGSHSEFFYVVK